MAIYKELLLLKRPIVWQLDQPERAVSEDDFVLVFLLTEKAFSARAKDQSS